MKGNAAGGSLRKYEKLEGGKRSKPSAAAARQVCSNTQISIRSKSINKPSESRCSPCQLPSRAHQYSCYSPLSACSRSLSEATRKVVRAFGISEESDSGRV